MNQKLTNVQVGNFLRPVGAYRYTLRIDTIYASGRMTCTRYGLNNEKRAYNDGHISNLNVLEPLTPIAPGVFKNYRETDFFEPKYWKLTSLDATKKTNNVTITKKEKSKMTRTKPAQADKRTMPLPGVPKKPGRPYTGKAKSNAERQATFRKKQAEAREAALFSSQSVYGKDSMETLKTLIAEGGPITFEGAWREIGRRKGWLK